MTEDVRRRDNIINLNEEAVAANTRMQWIARVRLVCLIKWHIGVGKRAKPKINKRVFQISSAGAAGWRCHFVSIIISNEAIWASVT